MILVINVKKEDSVYPQIKKWEAEDAIEIISDSEKPMRRSDKYRGKLSHKTAVELLREIEEGREE